MTPHEAREWMKKNFHWDGPNEAAAPQPESVDITEWDELYEKYQHFYARHLLDQCKEKGMTAAEASEWMQDNIVFTDDKETTENFKQQQVKKRLERIQIIRDKGIPAEYPWMAQAREDAKKLGIDISDYE